MSAPLFSILLPVIKVRHLRQALDSVLAQTCGDFEVVLVDNVADGPTEGLVEDPRLRRVVNTERKPMVANWNHGLAETRGTFVLLLSDDDVLEPDYLQTVKALVEAESDVHLVKVGTRMIDDEGRPLRELPPGPGHEPFKAFLDARLLHWRDQFISDFVFRRSTLLEAGGFVDFPGGWDADVQTTFRVALRNGCHHVPKILFNYRVHAQSVSGEKASADRLAGALAARAHFLARLLPALLRAGASVREVRRYLRYYRKLVFNEVHRFHPHPAAAKAVLYGHLFTNGLRALRLGLQGGCP